MKKILFVTKSMGCGGVERTLINYLKTIDQTKYSIDLLLTEKQGEFLNEVPQNVNVRELLLPNNLKYVINNYGNTIRYEMKKGINISFLIFALIKVVNKICCRLFKKNIFYYFCLNKIDYRLYDYDIVCDYHGYGFFSTLFVSNFKKEVKKLSWIHEENIYDSYKNIKDCYKNFDAIIGVSNECIDNFKNRFNDIDYKTYVIHNLVFKDHILELSREDCNDLPNNDNYFNIVSVGRLSYQKGFDLAIDVAIILKNRGYKFNWIIIGDGPDKENLESTIKDNRLDNYVFFVGFKNNPYKYMKMSDLYVQCSRYEGFVTTITEAVFLEKAIISTKFSGVKEQVFDDINGYIVNFDKYELADKIEYLINNKVLLHELEKGNLKIDLSAASSLEKLYKIFESR